ncbi:mCpol domain-containing protein [Janthinobacterium sp. GW458P]|uniref:mCpol domain-containing protein n=1 Tax=Janthinobacterium sp. GW458P TaxID=1981504 RepID=UPI000A3247BF|nr:mCpol domain-containing protein [Janthinobacterium sp. GW458P]MBE3026186.1 mCpol domain-containing protein [Janthinobacterium sp. GW458P]
MKYITIDGDDVGQKIASAYLHNDLLHLININEVVKQKTDLIAEHLRSINFVIIFCAADGVAAYSADDNIEWENIFLAIKTIASSEMSFSAGCGSSLREAYVALLSAKASGKGCIHIYDNIDNYVSNN